MAIAIDAMGGDFSPKNPILGAVKAVNEYGLDVVLVGDEHCVKTILDGHRVDNRKIEIVHASQTVAMDETIASALRTKKDSSLRVCFDLHKKGEVDGVVSAGHSGAMMAIGRYVLKMIPGIHRPCISAILPSLNEKVLLVDAGANTECGPNHLFQFAVLGFVYMKHFHGLESPRIGLLNIGSEEGKGDERTRKTYDLLKQTSLNFIGNIEGKEFFNGHVDVVVTDGFAGNILLKSVQAAASFVTQVFEQEIEQSLLMKLGAFLMTPVFRRWKSSIDYAKYGGAPLLGLRGNGVVCHGRSNPDALLNGIKFAQWAADNQLVQLMEEKTLAFQGILTQND